MYGHEDRVARVGVDHRGVREEGPRAAHTNDLHPRIHSLEGADRGEHVVELDRLPGPQILADGRAHGSAAGIDEEDLLNDALPLGFHDADVGTGLRTLVDVKEDSAVYGFEEIDFDPDPILIPKKQKSQNRPDQSNQ